MPNFLPPRGLARAALSLMLIAVLSVANGCDTSEPVATPHASAQPPGVIRVATFNAALSGKTADDLPRRLATPDDAKLQKIAAIIQRVRPDVLLINEFDHDPTGRLASDFQNNYLGVAQHGQEPITFAHAYSPPVNTGLPTGIDLDGDGTTTGPGDAHGWGDFHGQYGMLLLSRLPDGWTLQSDAQTRPWLREGLYDGPDPIFPAEAQGQLRLSSKTHQIITTTWTGRPIAVVISHPTPPVFDGPEDRNGKRNYDEIGLTAELLIESYIIRPTVVLGDLNADPQDGESVPGAIQQLLDLPVVQDPQPRSRGAAEQALADGGINAQHQTDSATDTADWGDVPPRGSGNLRVDYVLPTKDWTVVDAGVFWPATDEVGHAWINASDHRLVWVDLTLDAE